MIKNYLIEPARFKLDGGAMYGIIPKPLWSKNHPADELNRIDLALRLWLIQSEDKLILIDTGIGDYHGDTFDQRFDVRSDKHPIELALAKLGFHTSDVTDLVISHLHFDHVGGIGYLNDKNEMQPVLEQATCHVHRNHYDYALAPTARDGGSFHVHNFKPMLDYYAAHERLKYYDGDDGELFELEPGHFLKFKCSFGHTPWLMHPYTDEFIYLSDLVPTSHHISVPWVMGYDISPGITTQNKEEFYQFIKDKNLSVIYEHDPNFWGSKLEQNKKGRFVASENFMALNELAYSVSR
jgi:glyoxylase-like metal-dependent hydrolase (beta-lactamase superfamily II)